MLASRGCKHEARLLLLQESRDKRPNPQGSLLLTLPEGRPGRTGCAAPMLPSLGSGSSRGLCEGWPGWWQGSGWALGAESRQPWQHALPATTAAFCGGSSKVNSVVVACYQLNPFPPRTPFHGRQSEGRDKALHYTPPQQITLTIQFLLLLSSF